MWKNLGSSGKLPFKKEKEKAKFGYQEQQPASPAAPQKYGFSNLRENTLKIRGTAIEEKNPDQERIRKMEEARKKRNKFF